jgi:hypothetical protein
MGRAFLFRNLVDQLFQQLDGVAVVPFRRAIDEAGPLLLIVGLLFRPFPPCDR